jgi:hypothetical protein
MSVKQQLALITIILLMILQKSVTTVDSEYKFYVEHCSFCCAVSISDVIHSYSLTCHQSLCRYLVTTRQGQQCMICLETIPRKCWSVPYGGNIKLQQFHGARNQEALTDWSVVMWHIHKVSEIGSISIIRYKGKKNYTLLDLSERVSLNHWSLVIQITCF